MKICKRTVCIIISLVMLVPLIYTAAQFYPGTVLMVSDPESTMQVAPRIERIADGTELVVVAVITIALLAIIWLGVYEKNILGEPKKRKKT